MLCVSMTHERLQPLKPGSNIMLDFKNMLESSWSVLSRSKSVILLPQQWLLFLLKSAWTRLPGNLLLLASSAKMEWRTAQSVISSGF